jgi:Protein of unknown function (DUF3626)
MALTELADADDRDLLDDYVEAHVHGPLRLDRDVEAVVLDARVVGLAVHTGRYDPQVLKRLWHCVARFGGVVESGA